MCKSAKSSIELLLKGFLMTVSVLKYGLGSRSHDKMAIENKRVNLLELY